MHPVLHSRPAARGFSIIMALILACLLAGCSKTQLYTGVSEREANEMIAVLMAKGISAEKTAGEENTFALSVDQSQFAEAVDILRALGLPRDKFVSLGETFKKSGMVSSPSEDKIRFMYALSQSLSETLTHIDGVITARVHIVLPENDPLTEKFYPSSAAVFIKYRPGSPVDALQPQIKTLVADSIEGLKYNQVTLVLVPADDLIAAKTAVGTDPDRLYWIAGLGLIGLAAVALIIQAWWRRQRENEITTVVETARLPSSVVTTK